MSPAEVLQIFEPLCSAVDYAHGQGMVHRDIKPSNVLLTTQGEPVLTDYGIAKMIGVTQHTATGTVMGSAYYMSPEQAQGIAVDGRSDIYSLGVMLFEVLAGHVPYEGDTLATVLVKHITAPVPAVCPLNAGPAARARRPHARGAGQRPRRALPDRARRWPSPCDRGWGRRPPAEAPRRWPGPCVERPARGGTGASGLHRREGAAPRRRPGPRTRVRPGTTCSSATRWPTRPSRTPSATRSKRTAYAAGWRRATSCPARAMRRPSSSAIHTARVFVLVFSSATNQSQQVERELDMAVASRLPLVPLRVEDVMPRESIEYYLAGQHWLDAITPPLDVHLARLSEAIAALLEQIGPGGRRHAEPVAEPARVGHGRPGRNDHRASGAGRAPRAAPAPAPQTATTYEAPVAPPPAAEPDPGAAGGDHVRGTGRSRPGGARAGRCGRDRARTGLEAAVAAE